MNTCEHEKGQRTCGGWKLICQEDLPASFRFGQDVDPIIRQQLEQEVEQLVGKESNWSWTMVKEEPFKSLPQNVFHLFLMPINWQWIDRSFERIVTYEAR